MYLSSQASILFVSDFSAQKHFCSEFYLWYFYKNVGNDVFYHFNSELIAIGLWNFSTKKCTVIQKDKENDILS